MVNSQFARDLLLQHGKCKSQGKQDWSGTIDLHPELRRYYLEVGPCEIEIAGLGNPTFIPSLAGLWDLQAGYRWRGFSGEVIDDWPSTWLVVAHEGGNPYILDLESTEILFALCGAGKWEATILYNDLHTMSACLAILGSVVKDSENILDAELNVSPLYVEIAIKQLSEILSSKTNAELVVKQAGWI